ncbi:hypothetical protein [Pseudopontixanthobacter vadosimaris]|uniref:hypothetical protein n=1 Tax=Pseudopontixanthobacter vadosimaris TaxID=2726450 RepID=UPI001475DF4C|nr:hypothetical protein [Pseudopontixanthobacter vadosimaris]
MADQGEPIEQPAVYRSLVFAFAIWAAHFMVAYGAALVFPGQMLARGIAILALPAALAALFLWLRRLDQPRPFLAMAALGLSAVSIIYGTLPAFIG